MPLSVRPRRSRRCHAFVSLSSLVLGGFWAVATASGQQDDADASFDRTTDRASHLLTSRLPGKEAMSVLTSLEGEWEMVGTTHRPSDDAPAGSSFTARQTARWEIPDRVLKVEWLVVDGAGAVIGDGRSRIAYDEIASAVVNTYAGNDRDTRFSGSATLIDASDGVLEWRGHETRGLAASVNFEVTYLFPDPSTFTVDFIPTCVDGEVGPRPSRFTWTRSNSFLSAIPFVDRWMGAWSNATDATLESRIRFGPGRRSLVIESFPADRIDREAASLMETIWFDPRSRVLRYRGHRDDGSWMEGAVVVDVDSDGLLVDWRGVDRMGGDDSGRLRLSLVDRALMRAEIPGEDETSTEASGAIAAYDPEDAP